MGIENIIILIGLVLLIIGFIIPKVKKEITSKNKTINEFSFQKYAKFYGDTVLVDKEFNKKINKIYELIINKKMEDIKLIAEQSGCTYNECILKIKYLKNKRAIGDYYIDHINGIIKKCSAKDKELINKYKPFIYGKHLQIDEIAIRLSDSTVNTLEKKKEEVFNELKYLIQKDLINGMILNEVDRKIIYYSVEKHKKEKDFISIVCSRCGALNDVNRGSKIRCEYCDSIIEDKIKK